MKDKKNLTKDARFELPQQQTHTGEVVLNPGQRKQLNRFSQDLDRKFWQISIWHAPRWLYNRLKNMFN